MSPPFRHFVIVRGDMALGAQFAQLMHGVGDSCEGHPRGTYAYALEARDEDHLLELARKFWEAEIPHVVVHEPDPPFSGEATAIGVFLTQDKARIDKVTSGLPLLGKKGRA